MSSRKAPSNHSFIACSPLWSRAPSRDAQGRPYSDFMMLIPGLKQQGEAAVQSCLCKIRNSLSEFEQHVVYIDLNLRLNLLWISIRPEPGIMRPMVLAIQRDLPQARVVAADFNPEPERRRGSKLMLMFHDLRRHRLIARIPLLGRSAD